MKCPYCQNLDDKVIDSRVVRDGGAIRRRRECTTCDRRYTTYEYIENVTHTVVKRDGRREDFDRQKLEQGIKLACSKRSISFDTIQSAVDSIIEKLHSLHLKEIPHQTIGQMVMDELKNIDHVAYVRFASVYRQFEAKEDFVREVREIEKDESK
ncbi:transcriptional repressor NrdR [candidate division KSB1 bacterium]|nr:transcriptional repressor NrdR [candidate division KSB1 bacterium]